jgi:hypothetical protein
VSETGRAGTADVVVVAIIDFRRLGCIGATQTIGHDESWMAGEIRGHELHARSRRDNDVHFIEERRHLLDCERSCTVGLDVFDRGIKARGAKQVGPVFRTLRGEKLVAA